MGGTGTADRSTSSSVLDAPSNSSTMWPSRITSTRWQKPSSSASSLETMTTPIPLAANSAITRYISDRAPTSTPRVGSSSNSTRQEGNNQRARPAFCWLPPENSRAGRSGASGWVFSDCRWRVASRRSLARSVNGPRRNRLRAAIAVGRLADLRPAEPQPFGLSLLWREAEPGPDGQVRPAGWEAAAVDLDFARLRRVQAVDEAQEGGATRTPQDGHA